MRWFLFLLFLLALLSGASIKVSWGAEAIPHDAARYQRDLTRNARLAWGLDAPVATFAAQIHQESRWNPTARSGAGAQGIAQFMPATAKWIGGAYPKLGAGAASNPVWSMRALATYDKHLWDQVGIAPSCERFAFALSGYNGGLGWVRRDRAIARARGDDPALWFGHTERYNAGRSAAAWRENRGYPRRILKTLEPMYARAGWGKGMCL